MSLVILHFPELFEGEFLSDRPLLIGIFLLALNLEVHLLVTSDGLVCIDSPQNVSIDRFVCAITAPTLACCAVEKLKSLARFLGRIVKILDPYSLEVVQRVQDIRFRVEIIHDALRLSIKRLSNVEIDAQVS